MFVLAKWAVFWLHCSYSRSIAVLWNSLSLCCLVQNVTFTCIHPFFCSYQEGVYHAGTMLFHLALEFQTTT